MLVFGGAILVSLFIIKLLINGTVKKTFKYNYLNKKNIYIYYGFISICNALIYVIIGIMFFNIFNNFNDAKLFSDLSKTIIIISKYGISILTGLFMALNIVRDIAIVKESCKFVFELDYE